MTDNNENETDSVKLVGSSEASDAYSGDIEMGHGSVSTPQATSPIQVSLDITSAVKTESGWRKYTNKGDLSNLFTFVLMVIGICLHYLKKNNEPIKYLLAFGLFGFAGGITNWLAVKMLFDRIPGMIGSGVIPRQFKEIRSAIKETIMKMFFDPAYLESYIGERSQSLVASIDIGEKITELMSGDSFDTMLATKLTELSVKPEGMMIASMAPMFGGIEGMVPVLKPMLLSFGKEMGDQLKHNFDPLKYITVDKVREEIDSLMTEKLKQLTPEMVKKLMEDVIRKHLGWLVVWGNVFGGLIGLVSQGVGYGA